MGVASLYLVIEALLATVHGFLPDDVCAGLGWATCTAGSACLSTVDFFHFARSRASTPGAPSTLAGGGACEHVALLTAGEGGASLTAVAYGNLDGARSGLGVDADFAARAAARRPGSPRVNFAVDGAWVCVAILAFAGNRTFLAAIFGLYGLACADLLAAGTTRVGITAVEATAPGPPTTNSTVSGASVAVAVLSVRLAGGVASVSGHTD